jgi:replicative DNA helicase
MDAGAAKTPELFPLSRLIDSVAAESNRRFTARSTGQPFGPLTPFPKLTEQWGGCISDGLHIVLGGSGVGKTALGLQLAGECSCPCLYITCEMTPGELLRRTTARVTKTYLGKFKDGTLTGRTVADLAGKAAEQCPRLVIADATQVYARPEWIKQAAETIKAGNDHLLIVVDSLHSWAESAGAESQDYELISAACRELRTLAANLECPIIAISERNRASFAKGASKDKVGAGAGSRKIEYGSESVLSLERDDDQGPSPTGDQAVTLQFAKNRNGAAGREIKLIFEGGFQRYREA